MTWRPSARPSSLTSGSCSGTREDRILAFATRSNALTGVGQSSASPVTGCMPPCGDRSRTGSTNPTCGGRWLTARCPCRSSPQRMTSARADPVSNSTNWFPMGLFRSCPMWSMNGGPPTLPFGRRRARSYAATSADPVASGTGSAMGAIVPATTRGPGRERVRLQRAVRGPFG